MILQHELIKVGVTRALGIAFLPSYSVILLGGMITWKYFKHTQIEPKKSNKKSKQRARASHKMHTGMDKLTLEHRELAAKIAELQLKIATIELQKATHQYADHSQNNASVETPEKTNTRPEAASPKAALFQLLINDNVNFRSADVNTPKRHPSATATHNPNEAMFKSLINDNVNFRSDEVSTPKRRQVTKPRLSPKAAMFKSLVDDNISFRSA